MQTQINLVGKIMNKIDIFQDKEFIALPQEKQTQVLTNYFDKNIADDEFVSLPQEKQTLIKQNFINSQLNISQEKKEAPKKVESDLKLEEPTKNSFLDKVKDIGASKIEDILNSFPEINPEWLLTGKGEMLKQPEGSAKVSPNPKDQYIIDLQKKHIAKLEEELAELKKAQKHPSGYGMVAESESKLKKK